MKENRRRGKGSEASWAILGVGLLILGIILPGCNSSSRSEPAGSKPKKGTVAQKESPSDGVPQSFAHLAEKMNPAVVNISTTQVVKGGRPFGFPGGQFGERDPFGDFFGRFFGEAPQREFKQHSLGSGFVISADGYILTNHHVIENATEVKIIFADKESLAAKIVGQDPKTDLAVLKIKSNHNFSIAPLGDSDKLSVGDWVVAFGNPFGLGHTVTAGIVSGKGRIIGAGPYDNFVQTDASINPGNSGGPLCNLDGEVIGINTAIIAQGQGIGFAIPINLAKEVLPQLKEKGQVTRGWMGVAVQEVTPELAQSFGLKEPHGALVADVVDGGPAAKAGIQRGDVIVEFGGKKIVEMNDLPRIVANTPVGKEVILKIIRNHQEKSLKVVTGELKEDRLASMVEEPKGVEDELGLATQELTPEQAQHLGLKQKRGVVISEVEPGSPADEAGLQRGDLIEEVNRSPVRSLEDYRKALQKSKASKSFLFLVRRGESTIYTALKLG